MEMESEKGKVVAVYSAFFNTLCSGIGIQALLIPIAFATLGWAWGSLCLSLAYAWQLYTAWLLVHLHEPDGGMIRHSHYVGLAEAAFGVKLGKLLAIFPVMNLSAGACVLFIITGGRIMDQISKIIGGDIEANSWLTGTEWHLVFISIAVLIAQTLPTFNSLYRVSHIGSFAAVGYCTLLWVLSLIKGKPDDISQDTSRQEKSGMKGFANIMEAVGIIVLAFRGHNIMLEIQGTLPSSETTPASKPMWTGVTASYTIIQMCLFPLAFFGFWDYGNNVPINGGMLEAFWQFHKDDTSKYLMGLIWLLMLISCLCSYQYYAMPIFDQFEQDYFSWKKKPVPRLVRACFRIFFGGMTFFISVAFPFMGRLAILVGGLSSPLTYVYPCFMWNIIKKPQNGAVLWLNLGLGCLGIALSMVLVVAASWNLADKGLVANFFKP